jgi:DNA-binding transcriptional ArsR family regulator
VAVSRETDLAAIARLMADDSRAAMLNSLTGGSALSASELAAAAGIGRAAASEHLAKLTRGGLVAVEPRGRHRYFSLAGDEVAAAVEAMGAVAPPLPVRSLREAAVADALHFARTCYDHLAGRVGVAVTDALVARRTLRVVDGEFRVSRVGRTRLAALGVPVEPLEQLRRPLTRRCLDWSERRPHLAGALGAALLDRLLELGWIERVRGKRQVRVSEAGADGLRREFGVKL